MPVRVPASPVGKRALLRREGPRLRCTRLGAKSSSLGGTGCIVCVDRQARRPYPAAAEAAATEAASGASSSAEAAAAAAASSSATAAVVAAAEAAEAAAAAETDGLDGGRE